MLVGSVRSLRVDTGGTRRGTGTCPGFTNGSRPCVLPGNGAGTTRASTRTPCGTTCQVDAAGRRVSTAQQPPVRHARSRYGGCRGQRRAQQERCLVASAAKRRNLVTTLRHMAARLSPGPTPPCCGSERCPATRHPRGSREPPRGDQGKTRTEVDTASE